MLDDLTLPVPLFLVSACLLGANVRYDGGHRNNPYIKGEIGRFAKLTGLCPEVDSGMSAPRPEIMLVTSKRRPKKAETGVTAVSPGKSGGKTGREMFDRLESYSEKKSLVYAQHPGRVHGLILKSRSPSCGIGSAELHFRDSAGKLELVSRKGSGVFVSAMKRRMPLVPMIDEESIQDEANGRGFFARADFLRHIFALQAEPGLMGKLLEKFALELYSHSPAHHRRAMKLAAEPLTSAVSGELARTVIAGLSRLPTTTNTSQALLVLVDRAKPVVTPGILNSMRLAVGAYRGGVETLCGVLGCIRGNLRGIPPSRRPADSILACYPPQTRFAPVDR